MKLQKIQQYCTITLCLLIAGCMGSPKEPGRFYGQGYSIKLPDGWQKTGTAPGASQAWINKEGNVSLNILIQKTGKLTLTELVNISEQRARSAGVTVTRSENLTLGGLPGSTNTKNLKIMGRNFLVQEYTTIKEGTGYSLILTIEQSQADNQRHTIESLIETFRFE